MGKLIEQAPTPSRRQLLAGAAATVGGAAGSLLLGTAPAQAAAGPALQSGASRAAKRYRTRLVLLGTAGGPTWYGEGSTHGICSAVVVDGSAYLIDFGSGAYRQSRRAGIAPGTENALFFTHLHTDHTIDIANLLMYDPSARRRAKAQLNVIGPGPRGPLPVLTPGLDEPPLVNPDNPGAGTTDLVRSVTDAYAADQNTRVRSEGGADVRQFFAAHDITLPASLNWNANTNPVPDMEPFVVWADDKVQVSATLVPHGHMSPNFAFRIDSADGSVAFSGDTAVSDNLVRLAQGADMLVHEVIDTEWVLELVGPKPWNARQQALFDQIIGGHTQIHEVGQVAERAGVETLVLSHLVPGDNPRSRWFKAREGFSGKTIVGEDLMELGVGMRLR